MKQLIGNAVVGQSGGPTAAINATLAGVIKGALSSRSIQALYGMQNGIEGFLSEHMIDLTARFSEAPEDLELLMRTPAAALGSCRKKLPKPSDEPAFYEHLLLLFRKYNIRYFFYIGGNDSMDTVAKLTEYLRIADHEMVVMGVPKTIDNDLMGTDHTPGFGSAAKYISVMMQEILCDCAVYTVPAVTVVEIMGRDAGWLTASASIGRVISGREPDLVYLPEVAFDMDRFFADVRAALSRHPNVVVAVSEGLRFANGRYVGEGTQTGATDVFGHAYLAGTGKALELAVKQEIGCKVRSIELNLPQRCASHLASEVDISESVALGERAVRAAEEGITGEMMCLTRLPAREYTVEITHRNVSQIANRTRYVPAEFINESGNGVTDECCRYLAPLIKGEVAPFWINGLPAHFIFDKKEFT